MWVGRQLADLGHTATPLAQHIEWVWRLQFEFFEQGDEERKARLAISPLMDRTKDGPCNGAPASRASGAEKQTDEPIDGR
eukprot:1175827-Prorocentrum_minimum.AAC.1